jgi:hypothetical protein
LSPRQIVVIPVAAPFKEYATRVAKTFWDAGLFAEADLSDNTLNKKIRNAQTSQWNFIMGWSSCLPESMLAETEIQSLDRTSWRRKR